MKYFFLFFFHILVRRCNILVALLSIVGFYTSIAYAIEVGGHLTENTIWSPENNPYEVIENLYVDSEVTLTILPGTVVKLQSTLLTSYDDFYQSFCYPNNDAVMIWVNGRIVAVGTEQDSIKFTKLQDEQDNFWGCLYFAENSEIPVLKYVDFQYSAGISIAVGHIADACISIRNHNLLVNNCTFNNNAASILVYNSYLENVEVTDCIFDYSLSSYFVENLWGSYHCGFTSPSTNYKHPLFANNNLYNKRLSARSINYIFNSLHTSINGIHISDDPPYGTDYFYNNMFINCYTGIDGGENNFYIKDNSFVGGYNAINIDDAYVEIMGNYFNGNIIDVAGCGQDVIFTNNFVENSNLFCGIINVITNNIFINNVNALSGIGIEAFTNNVFLNNNYIFSTASDQHIIENNIFLNNEEVYNNVYGNPIFRHCIIDFPLDPPLIDGGGNIIVDSLQAQEIFEDIENGDFHLAANSIAIDTGLDTLDYYYPFDLENNVRVWDGNGDGNDVIDIGAYEYDAPQLGKITGYIMETESGEPVDYVLLKANNEPGEFTFADSSGYFEIQLPEGTYDLYAERVFYEDNIIYTVTVENEQNAELNFNMTYNDPLVSINENELNINNSTLKTSNYPNPFNPTTTISFNTVTECNVLVEVFNIKGQKVKTLINKKMNKGQHSVIWNGINKNNQVVSSGIYLYKIRAGKEELVKRMILLK